MVAGTALTPARRSISVPRLWISAEPLPFGVQLMLAYAFLLPVQVAGAFRFAPSDLLIGLYLLIRLPTMRRARYVWTKWHVSVVAVIWLGLFTARLTTGEVSKLAAVNKGFGILVLILTYACLVDALTTLARVRALLRAFVLGTVVSAVVSLAAMWLNLGLSVVIPVLNEPYPRARLAGLLLDPNAYGGLLAAALVAHLALSGGNWQLLGGWASRLATLSLSAALVLSFSRSAWIGALAGIVAVAALDRGAARRMRRRLRWPALLVLPALTLPGIWELVDRPDQVLARLSIGGDALDEFLRSPMIGIGLGVFEQRHDVIVHNTVLWFLAELGLIGLVAFVGFFTIHLRWGVRSVLRGGGQERALAIAALGTAFVGLGLSVGIEAFYQRSWWLAFATLGALHRLNRERAA